MTTAPPAAPPLTSSSPVSSGAPATGPGFHHGWKTKNRPNPPSECAQDVEGARKELVHVPKLVFRNRYNSPARDRDSLELDAVDEQCNMIDSDGTTKEYLEFLGCATTREIGSYVEDDARCLQDL